MTIKSLGYIGIGSTDPEQWTAFAEAILGMRATRHDGGDLIQLRMDDHRHRIHVHQSDRDDGLYYGWDVGDAAGLASLAARVHETAGIEVTAGTPEELAQRGVDDLRWFTDPAGHRVELFHGLATDPEPFEATRAISGFVTGEMGLGHVVLLVERIDEVRAFYLDILGFKVSDFMTAPFNAVFLHANPRHHSVALLEAGAVALHHFMVELEELDDVGSTYDLVQDEKIEVAATLGRHSNDRMLSFYMRSPAGFQIEYGWGGLLIDDDTWEVNELEHGPSTWGHVGIG
jgi:2,3-dihydroxybiphenyl 1,2-dioxygenase